VRRDGVTLTSRVLIGLVAGFLLGLALAEGAPQAATYVAGVLAPVGAVFVSLIRMTAIPLVASMLIASLGAMTAPGGLGRLTIRTALIALAMLLAAATASALVAGPVLARVTVDQQAVLALGGSAVASAPPSGSPGLSQWVVDLVPPNVVEAAADGAVLPVIVFAVLFGLALGRIREDRRTAVVAVFDGIADAMQRLVAWILALAPIGVFALAVPLAARLGLSFAGVVVAYVGLVVVLTVAAMAVFLYPVAIIAGRMSATAFIGYTAPAQAIAFASRSSLASLPAAVSSAERAGLSAGVARFILPLAVSVFHFGAAVAQTVGVMFLASLYGVPLGPSQLASIIAAVVLASFAVPSIPGGSIITLAPVLSAAGLPLDGIGILLAVDTVPDMFRTTANLTGAMTVAAILPREAAGAR
jgi:Na+/H+-dicarboxylate symporter